MSALMKIKTVREFTKSRYCVCFLFAMVGLYFLLTDFTISFDDEITTYLSDLLFSLQSYLGQEVVSDLIKLISFYWLLIFLAAVVAGNNLFSQIIGGITILVGLIRLGGSSLETFSIGNSLWCLSLIYFGWHIAANSFAEQFELGKCIGFFFLSRMFVGFCLIVFGLIELSNCFVSAEVFVNYTQDENLRYFIVGNIGILSGIAFMMTNRRFSGFFIGLLMALFCALMILQLPTIILFFVNSELIRTYYSNIAFHWSMIIAVIAYIGVACLIFFTSDNWKFANEEANKLMVSDDDDVSSDENWVCTKCYENNDKRSIYCKSCGEYK
jgi:hypothetical protein